MNKSLAQPHSHESVIDYSSLKNSATQRGDCVRDCAARPWAVRPDRKSTPTVTLTPYTHQGPSRRAADAVGTVRRPPSPPMCRLSRRSSPSGVSHIFLLRTGDAQVAPSSTTVPVLPITAARTLAPRDHSLRQSIPPDDCARLNRFAQVISGRWCSYSACSMTLLAVCWRHSCCAICTPRQGCTVVA